MYLNVYHNPTSYWGIPPPWPPCACTKDDALLSSSLRYHSHSQNYWVMMNIIGCDYKIILISYCHYILNNILSISKFYIEYHIVIIEWPLILNVGISQNHEYHEYHLVIDSSGSSKGLLKKLCEPHTRGHLPPKQNTSPPQKGPLEEAE